jgi:tyrosyl-tRNA synthetase
MVPIMAMAHLQRAGHVPISIIGGGTTLIGDPSGKSEMRKMMTPEQIEANGRSILAQLQKLLVLDGTRGFFVNNADWLTRLNYIEFLRDIGRHFRVNDMIKNEGYRLRLEREEGLSFIEFNYQLLQAYDFLVLARTHNCELQLGGDDQWGNILAGVSLVRRMEQREVFGLTFPLLVTATGGKMGKTEAGTVWLDPTKTTPYDFYQYWINTDDRDVERFFKYFTFLSLPEIAGLCAEGGQALNAAKQRLAFEVTSLLHGTEAAAKAQETARSLFGGGGGSSSEIPTATISRQDLSTLKIQDILVMLGAAPSKAEATRLLRQRGISFGNDLTIISEQDTAKAVVGDAGEVIFRRGKKQFYKLRISG